MIVGDAGANVITTSTGASHDTVQIDHTLFADATLPGSPRHPAFSPYR